MPGGLGPRLTLEAGFLILLAVVVGFADLSPALIILVMALGWMLVSLIEYFAWRQGPRFPAAREPWAAVPAGTAPGFEQDRAEEFAPPPAPSPRPPPAEEDTVVEPAPAEEAPEAEAQPAEPSLAPEPAERTRHRLEPLQPRPKRRWLPFGRRDRAGGDASAGEAEGSAEGSREEER